MRREGPGPHLSPSPEFRSRAQRLPMPSWEAGAAPPACGSVLSAQGLRPRPPRSRMRLDSEANESQPSWIDLGPLRRAPEARHGVAATRREHPGPVKSRSMCYLGCSCHEDAGTPRRACPFLARGSVGAGCSCQCCLVCLRPGSLDPGRLEGWAGHPGRSQASPGIFRG